MCLILCNLMYYSPPDSSVHGISQARILEWVALSSSRGSSWPRNQTRVSCHLLHWQADSLLLSHVGSPSKRTMDKQTDNLLNGRKYLPIIWPIKVNVQNIKTTYIKLYQVSKQEEEEDGGRVKMGRLPASPQTHQNSSRYGTTPTKQTLGDSIRSQASRGGRLTSLKWGRREDGDIKWEDMENFWTGACVPREGESCEGGTVPMHWEAPL